MPTPQDQRRGQKRNALIVVPCLNEAQHIAQLLEQLTRTLDRVGGRIVVVDGGSTDGTKEIVSQFVTSNPRVTLLHNPDRIQSAGINLAVSCAGENASHLFRIDAHCGYPDDYCDRLMAEMDRTGADSIVVSMIAEGEAIIQQVNAAAQNAPVGNGGSSHRMRTEGQFVDHGHHALMRLSAFRAVGGYDPAFTHNEDAELDFRLRERGYRIWLTPDPAIVYFPRSTFKALARQYCNYGRGRAGTFLKHAIVPRLRQTKVMAVLPALLLALFSSVHWVFALPALLWLAVTLGAGLGMAIRERRPKLVLVGVSAMVMHVSWSYGFWRKLLEHILGMDGSSLKAAR
ncbi:glycosyltransferase family 2 protein [Qingshengfaniella alkalisoli]|uniref:Glycosyltransferase family 2 protein n=1 Tax=Qingshengfaniella alkalisoli TaxID=2599296 RepID=A0A5B8J4W8_9RHOB|nr:glycosyltransferase family 2 protein [Qingshengfaniella alkalisoli]QDY71738.1 glycosyltransferase family 2 protein [Qingshengfaniella alkalisoli]